MKRFALASVLGIAGMGMIVVGCSKAAEEPAPSASSGAASTSAVAAARFVEVNEILKRNCLGCHSGPTPKEGFSVVSYESVMKGYEHGPVLVAGDPAGSKIIQVLRDTGPKRMPFKMAPLSEEDIQKIESWIQAGAKND